MLIIIGFVVVTVGVIGGYLMEHGALSVLWQPAEYVIIGGAAIGSLLVSTPGKVLKATAAQIKDALSGKGTSKADVADLLAMLYQIFKVAQQSGVMALESHFDNPQNSSILSRYPKFLARHHAVDFLADSVKVVIVGGLAAHDLEALMDEDLHVHHEEAGRPATALMRVSDALPGLGIVAAVLGVVITMGKIDGPPEEIGHSIGAALVGTFLGILMSYGFLSPLASHLEGRVADEGHYGQCIKAGLLAIYKGNSPAIAVEFARRVLPSDVRPTFEETEQFCRAATAGAPKGEAPAQAAA
jgi:chemotaxis protein MotA